MAAWRWPRTRHIGSIWADEPSAQRAKALFQRGFNRLFNGDGAVFVRSQGRLSAADAGGASLGRRASGRKKPGLGDVRRHAQRPAMGAGDLALDTRRPRRPRPCAVWASRRPPAVLRMKGLNRSAWMTIPEWARRKLDHRELDVRDRSVDHDRPVAGAMGQHWR